MRHLLVDGNLQRVVVGSLAGGDRDHLAERSSICVIRTIVRTAGIDTSLRRICAGRIDWIIPINSKRHVTDEVTDVGGLHADTAGKLLLNSRVDLIGDGPLVVRIDGLYSRSRKKARTRRVVRVGEGVPIGERSWVSVDVRHRGNRIECLTNSKRLRIRRLVPLVRRRAAVEDAGTGTDRRP